MDDLPPLTMSQENAIIDDLFQQDNLSPFGSSFTDIGGGLALSDVEENINLAQYVCPVDTVAQNNQTVYIKQEEPEAVSLNPCTMATGKLPCREPFEGALQFQLDVGALNTKSCLYSNKLNKLFTTVGSQCPMKFKWVGANEENLFLRAVPLFVSAQNLLYPVTRCMYHAHMNTCKGEVYSEHVIRAFHEGARYETNAESERLSVIVPLDRPQPGSDSVTVLIAFSCKNSCTGGMNRRSTEIVFTLENAVGSVLGRASLQFRVCSCPKRDLEKEERDAQRVIERDALDAVTTEKRDLQDTPVQCAKRRMRVIVKEDPTESDGPELVYIPALKSDAPELIKNALGLLLVKRKLPGTVVSPHEVELEKHYLELLSSKNKKP